LRGVGTREMCRVGKCRLSINYDCHQTDWHLSPIWRHRTDLSPIWFVTDMVCHRFDWHPGEHCKLPQCSLGQIPSRNGIWCILALKFGFWWLKFSWFLWQTTRASSLFVQFTKCSAFLFNFALITTLHGMHTGSGDEHSVCLSVCQTCGLWQNIRKICPDFYTIQKII